MMIAHLRAFAVVLLSFSVLFFMCNGILLVLIGFLTSDQIALDLNADNRPAVAPLVCESIKNGEEMPGIEHAVRIEYVPLLHKDKVTIFYNDGADFCFYIKDRGTPLVLYMRENGYRFFYRSTKFFVLVAKTAVPAALFVASIFFLKKTKPKPLPKRYRFERISKRVTK